MNLADKFIENHILSKEEFTSLVEKYENPDIREPLRAEADAIRRKYYGDEVFIRGLIEFTNYCKNNCYYCGIRRDNRNLRRYRLEPDTIFSCCDEGYELGFRTFVLQGGEDPYFTDERLTEVICGIKTRHPDCAVTLSIGERTKESYRLLRQAGADRFLLRHETANLPLYHSLHPADMSPENRQQCLYDLKELGFQVGAGFMVGAPGQTAAHIAEDLLFLKTLNPEMVGIGPFIPHHETRYADEKAGSADLTVFLLSVVRILLPKTLLPATTALASVDPKGREKGLKAGANVIMPNLSPPQNRADYALYDNKVHSGKESAAEIAALRSRVEAVGYRIVTARGDALG